jgi:ankyrin repeat protein
VDPINRLGETPLHLAISSTEIDEEDSGLREEVVESLLDAGADVTYVTIIFYFVFNFISLPSSVH